MDNDDTGLDPDDAAERLSDLGEPLLRKKPLEKPDEEAEDEAESLAFIGPPFGLTRYAPQFLGRMRTVLSAPY